MLIFLQKNLIALFQDIYVNLHLQHLLIIFHTLSIAASGMGGDLQRIFQLINFSAHQHT